MMARSKERYTAVEVQLAVSSLGRFSEGYQLHVCHTHQSPVYHQPHHQDSQYYKWGNVIINSYMQDIFIIIIIAMQNYGSV